ncbi:hypothetical protein [Kitasatospora sp. NBC_01539]|uniref:hypothetical protein n=1 Tax=Kitasatospora sp. NBC_01539 TaxID=2903577 RepID=UPI00386027EC
MIGSPATRALRAAVFTALAVPLAALGQVVLTGRPLPASLLLGCTVAVLLLGLALCDGRPGPWRAAAVMLPVQLLLTTAFNLGQAGCAPASARAHGMDLLVCGGGSVPSGPLLSGPVGPGGGAVRLTVLLVHLGLALAAALWLRLGEAAVGGAAAVLRTARAAAGHACRRLLLLLAPLPACPAVLAPSPGAVGVPPRPVSVVPTPAPRRGPPGYALAR